MVNNIVNGLIAGVVGAVAYIAVKALVSGSVYGPLSNHTYSWCDCLLAGGSGPVPANVSNCTTLFSPSAGEMMIHDILPLAVAIMVIAGLFLGLTRIKGA